MFLHFFYWNGAQCCKWSQHISSNENNHALWWCWRDPLLQKSRATKRAAGRGVSKAVRNVLSGGCKEWTTAGYYIDKVLFWSLENGWPASPSQPTKYDVGLLHLDRLCSAPGRHKCYMHPYYYICSLLLSGSAFSFFLSFLFLSFLTRRVHQSQRQQMFIDFNVLSAFSLLKISFQGEGAVTVLGGDVRLVTWGSN